MAKGEKTVGKLNVRLGMNLSEFNQGMQQFQREMKKAERSLKGLKILGDQLQSVGRALTTAITLPLVGLGVAAKKSFDAVDEGMDGIAIATNAVGKELASLQVSFKRVAAQVPNDLGEVGAIIGNLNKYLGATGKVVEVLAVKIAKSSHMLKEDATKATQSISQAVNKWGLTARQASKFLDQLFLASKTSGSGMTKLAEQLSQFQVPLKQMGFNLTESIALLANFERSGVNTEQVLGAMTRAMTTFAKAGISDGGAAFREIVKMIKNAKTESEAAAIAIKVFGSRAGPQLAAEIRSGRFEIEKLVKKFGDVGPVIQATFEDTADSAEILAAAKNSLMIALEPLGRELDKLARVILPPVITAIAKLTEKFDKLSQPAKTAIIAALGFVAAIGPIAIVAGTVIKSLKDIRAAFIALSAIGWGNLFANLGTFFVNMTKNTAVIVGLIGSISVLVKGLKQLKKGLPKDIDTFGEGFMWGLKQWKGIFDPFKALVSEAKKFATDLGKAGVSLQDNAMKRWQESMKNANPDVDRIFADNESKINAAAEAAGKNAGAAFSDAFDSVWKELWEKPFALGNPKVSTVEGQLNQLRYILTESEKRIPKSMEAAGVHAADDIWKQSAESAQAFASIWDQIYALQKKLVEQQIDALKKDGVTPVELGKIGELIKVLAKDARTAQAKLDIKALRESLGLEESKPTSEIFDAVYKKVRAELWDRPMLEGKLPSLEDQIGQLNTIKEQFELAMVQALEEGGYTVAGNLWDDSDVARQAYAELTDQIFELEKQRVDKELVWLKTGGLLGKGSVSPSDAPFDELSQALELVDKKLMPLAKTSQKQLETQSLRADLVAQNASDSYNQMLQAFEADIASYRKLFPDMTEVDLLTEEQRRWTAVSSKLLLQLEDTARLYNAANTPELEAVRQAVGARNAEYSGQITDAEAVARQTAEKQLAEILKSVGEISREELKDAWSKAIEYAAQTITLSTNLVKKTEEINEAFEARDKELKIEEWITAMDSMAEAVDSFNAEAATAVKSFRDIVDTIRRMPEITASMDTSFKELRATISKALEPYLGKNYTGNLFGFVSGAQTFGQGSSGERNLVGTIAGGLAGAGFMTPITGAVAIGAQMVNALFPGKAKSQEDLALQDQIEQYNAMLKEWGASYQSENVGFKLDTGFLGWRNLFGNRVYSTVNEDAAKEGAEIAQAIINSMTQVFNEIGNGAFSALFEFGGLDSLTQSVGKSLQSALMQAILSVEAIKQPMQQLSAYIAEAVQDGLTSAELDHVKAMTGEIWESLEPYEDIAKEIADEFGLAEESAKGIGEALRNVPSGFKIALDRFVAATGIQANTVLETNRTQVIIEGDVYGMDDFARRVETAVDKASTRRQRRTFGVAYA